MYIQAVCLCVRRTQTPADASAQRSRGGAEGPRPRVDTSAMPTQAERTEATRGALVAAGRRLFGARGYAAVGTEEIVVAAGVTRGWVSPPFPGHRGRFVP